MNEAGLLVIAYLEPGDMIFGVLSAIWSWIVVILPTLSASCVSELFAVANLLPSRQVEYSSNRRYGL